MTSSITDTNKIMDDKKCYTIKQIQTVGGDALGKYFKSYVSSSSSSCSPVPVRMASLKDKFILQSKSSYKLRSRIVDWKKWGNHNLMAYHYKVIAYHHNVMAYYRTCNGYHHTSHGLSSYMSWFIIIHVMVYHHTCHGLSSYM